MLNENCARKPRLCDCQGKKLPRHLLPNSFSTYPDSGLEEVGSLYHPVLYTEEVLSIANTELSPPLLSAKAGRKLDLPRKFKLWFIFVLKKEG